MREFRELLYLIVLYMNVQVLSNTIKQKRKEKAGKWEVPLPKVSRTVVFNCIDLLIVYFSTYFSVSAPTVAI